MRSVPNVVPLIFVGRRGPGVQLDLSDPERAVVARPRIVYVSDERGRADGDLGLVDKGSRLRRMLRLGQAPAVDPCPVRRPCLFSHRTISVKQVVSSYAPRSTIHH